jgi:hypothetical protein
MTELYEVGIRNAEVGKMTNCGIGNYVFSETALEKKGLWGAAMTQFIGFRCQVSGVREPRCHSLKPEH